MILTRTSKYNVSAQVRVHGSTLRGTVTKRPTDKRVYEVKALYIEGQNVFYDIEAPDGKKFKRVWERFLSRAA